VPVELRAVEQGDGAALHHVVAHPDVWRWLVQRGRTEAISPVECDAWARRDAAHWRAHGFGKWLALEGGLAVARGGLTVTFIAGRPEVELGWVVAREHWGRGIATQIGCDGLARARDLGLRDVVALTRTDNQRSLHVMAKVGLRRERDLDHAGWPHALFRAAHA
jgi:ribosomal-protein-alanine N-acetyltransferase